MCSAIKGRFKMDDGHRFFSGSFREAQQRLQAAAARMGVVARQFIHPLLGLDGEPLGTDVYLIGNPAARKVLAIESGTHGVEGYAGSAIQLALVDEILPHLKSPDIAVMIVHAVNPYGFSWRRRGDEQNIDVNRNFVDFADSNATRNELFEHLAPHLVPEQWGDEEVRGGDLALEGLRQTHGSDAVSRAMRRGQYSHPGSVFFGGRGPSWSRLTVETIADEYLATAADVLLLDVHTGLGSYGKLQLLSIEPASSPISGDLRRVFGPRLRSTSDPASGAANASGNIFAGYTRCLAQGRFLGIALEFGTVDQQRIQHALRADAWAYLSDDDKRKVFRERSRREMLEVFCPTDPVWRDLVVKDGVEQFRKALTWMESR